MGPIKLDISIIDFGQSIWGKTFIPTIIVVSQMDFVINVYIFQNSQFNWHDKTRCYYSSLYVQKSVAIFHVKLNISIMKIIFPWQMPKTLYFDIYHDTE